MNVSTDKNPAIAKYCRAWVDEVEVTSDCFEADDESGFVIVIDRIDGKIMADETGNVRKKTIVGSVRIGLVDNASDTVFWEFEKLRSVMA